jgi:tRNA(Ile)-lysidine synthase
VRRFCRRYRLVEPAATVVVGVSGGPDSLCLLHLLRRLAPEWGLCLHVAHLNHGLRGAEADADAVFVAELAAMWGLPCMVGRADVAGLAAEMGLSLEEAARQARYRFLAEVARGDDRPASSRDFSRSPVIAVGHNADDQAETVLMHFLRGSGVAGLRGMLPRVLLSEYRLGEPTPLGPSFDKLRTGSSLAGKGGALLPSPARGGAGGEVARRGGGGGEVARRGGGGGEVWLVRPLLGTPRAAIVAYCVEHGLQPRFDRSNEDTTFFRNRLRHELLPIMETYNPQIREVLAHTAEVLAGDYEVLRPAVEEAWAEVSPAHAGESWDEGPGAAVYFRLAAWRGLSIGLQRATIREAIHRLRSHLRNINWEHVERAVWLAREGGTGQRATLAAGLELQIGYTTLRVAAEGSAWPADTPQVNGSLRLNAPGVMEIGAGWQVIVRRLHRAELPADFAANPDPWTAYLDADVVGPEPILRPRQPGDRFQAYGLDEHSAAVNEFMINLKVPRDTRGRWPLLVGKCGIAWVCGLRLAARAAIQAGTREVWVVQFAQITESPRLPATNLPCPNLPIYPSSTSTPAKTDPCVSITRGFSPALLSR